MTRANARQATSRACHLYRQTVAPVRSVALGRPPMKLLLPILLLLVLLLVLRGSDAARHGSRVSTGGPRSLGVLAAGREG